MSLLGRYVGSKYAINDTGNALAKAKGSFVTDLKLSYDRDEYEIFMSANNIFSRDYNNYEATNGALTAYDVFPAPEENFLFGVNVKF